MSSTRKQIADAFDKRLVEVGYDKTNLDDVARDLRISKKTIYVHFDGKRDIYASLVARRAQVMKAELAASVAPLPTFTARVTSLLRAVLAAGRTHIAETGEEEWLREYEIAADAFRAATGELLHELVQGGMDAGEFRRGDAGLVERMVTAVIVEYLVLVNADQSYDRDAELLERLTAFIQ